MLTITADTHHEKIKIVDPEIVLNGPPTNLRGSIQVVNNHNNLLRVKTLGMVDKNKKSITDGSKDFLKLHFRLYPGEQKLQTIFHQLPAVTPPGIYENYIMVGDQMHKVKMIVQPTVEIAVFPDEFTFQGTAPGTTHVASMTVTNKGNMPFQVPELKHAAVLDMDILCRAFGRGFREADNENLMSTLDEVARNLKDNLADWVSISVDEAGEMVAPGDSLLLHVNFTLPENAVSKRDYDGNFRFWDKEISVLIKSHNEPKKNSSYEKRSIQ